jgi:hypothetical protein
LNGVILVQIVIANRSIWFGFKVVIC